MDIICGIGWLLEVLLKMVDSHRWYPPPWRMQSPYTLADYICTLSETVLKAARVDRSHLPRKVDNISTRTVNKSADSPSDMKLKYISLEKTCKNLLKNTHHIQTCVKFEIEKIHIIYRHV